MASLEGDLLYFIETFGQYEIEEEDGVDVKYYVKSDNCLASVNDFYRYLRKSEDRKVLIHKYLSEWGVIRNHLLPILVSNAQDIDLVIATLRLLYYLTLFPDSQARDLAELVASLQQYKECFLDPDVVMNMVVIMSDPVGDTSNASNAKIINYTLSIFKNLLEIPDPPLTLSSTEAHLNHMQNSLIHALKENLALDLIVTLAHKIDQNKNWALLFLELIHFILRRDKPQDLVDVSSDLAVLPVPSNKPARVQQGRHLSFGGIFVSKNKQTQQAALQKAPMQTSVKPLKSKNLALRDKRTLVVNKAPSPAAVKVILRDFSKNILSACYNELMHQVREELKANDPNVVMPGDFERYFWAIGFFTGFWDGLQLRLTDEALKKKVAPIPYDVANVSETFATSVFDDMFNKIDEYRLLKQHSSTEIVVVALASQLKMLVSMSRIGDERLQNISKQIRTKLFYENEQANLLDTIPPFVRVFAPRVNSRNYLIALLEIIHYTIALMEEEGGSIVTKKKMSAQTTTADEGIGADELQDDDDRPDPEKNALAERRQQAEEKEERRARKRFTQDRIIHIAQYVRRITTNSYIDKYVYLLRDYKKNSAHLHHVIASMFKRIAIDCSMVQAFFRISILRVLNDISVNVKHSDPSYVEILDVTKFITRQLMDAMNVKGAGVVAAEISFHHPKFIMDAYYPDVEGMLDDMMDRRMEEEEQEENTTALAKKDRRKDKPATGKAVEQPVPLEEMEDFDLDDELNAEREKPEKEQLDDEALIAQAQEIISRNSGTNAKEKEIEVEPAVASSASGKGRGRGKNAKEPAKAKPKKPTKKELAKLQEEEKKRKKAEKKKRREAEWDAAEAKKKQELEQAKKKARDEVEQDGAKKKKRLRRASMEKITSNTNNNNSAIVATNLPVNESAKETQEDEIDFDEDIRMNVETVQEPEQSVATTTQSFRNLQRLLDDED